MTPAALCSALFTDVDGYALSSEGREHVANGDDPAFTYGEVSPEAMEQILSAIAPRDRGTFYDLGSGTGKAVVLAAILGHFHRCTGIELLPELHRCATETKTRFDRDIRPTLPQRCSDMELRNADIFEADFSDADVIFCHCCTCFDDPLMEKLTRHLEHVKPECIVICVSRQLESDAFDLEQDFSCTMGWGEATVYVYRRA